MRIRFATIRSSQIVGIERIHKLLMAEQTTIPDGKEFVLVAGRGIRERKNKHGEATVVSCICE